MACSLWYRPLTFSFAPPASSDGVKSLAVLGVTGSIGRQTLEVADHLRIPVVAIGARTPSEDLLEIARRYPEARVAVATEDHESAAFVEAVGKRRVEFGPAALTAMAAEKGQVVMNGIVGVAGLPVTLAAAHAGNRVALANKESMVAAGALVNEALRAAEASSSLSTPSTRPSFSAWWVKKLRPGSCSLLPADRFVARTAPSLQRRPLPRLWLIPTGTWGNE